MNQNHNCECGRIRDILEGPRGKPREGLVWVVGEHNDVLYGTENEPGGLVKEFRDLKASVQRIIWIGTGINLAVGIVWILFTYFHKQ